jgi:hypothetical protein
LDVLQRKAELAVTEIPAAEILESIVAPADFSATSEPAGYLNYLLSDTALELSKIIKKINTLNKVFKLYIVLSQ